MDGNRVLNHPSMPSKLIENPCHQLKLTKHTGRNCQQPPTTSPGSFKNIVPPEKWMPWNPIIIISFPFLRLTRWQTLGNLGGFNRRVGPPVPGLQFIGQGAPSFLPSETIRAQEPRGGFVGTSGGCNGLGRGGLEVPWKLGSLGYFTPMIYPI